MECQCRLLLLREQHADVVMCKHRQEAGLAVF